MISASLRCVIVTADDFGLSESVNEAVERAHAGGVLAAASLMVAGPAANDAVRRARAMPSLAVGLHLVAVEGPAVLPHAEIPALADADGRFPSDQLGLALKYASSRRARAQLAAEIRAQFAAFAATGLKLDHLNAHKHMHLHPVVGALAIGIGREFGLHAVRVPAEPPPVLAACGFTPSWGSHALYRWTSLLRLQARRAGLAVNDHCFGIAWTGHMDATRLCKLADALPAGVSEIYSHPAARQDPQLSALMPDYDQAGELAALLDPSVSARLEANGVRRLRGYAELHALARRRSAG